MVWVFLWMTAALTLLWNIRLFSNSTCNALWKLLWWTFFPAFPIKTSSMILPQNRVCGETKKGTEDEVAGQPQSGGLLLWRWWNTWSQPDKKHLRRWAGWSKTNDSAGSLMTGWCQARTSCVCMGLKKKSCSFMLLWVCFFSFFPGRYGTGRKSQQLVTDPVNYHGDW